MKIFLGEMMREKMKEKRMNLIERYSKKMPNFLSVQKTIFVLLAILMSIRTLYFLSTIVLLGANKISLSIVQLIGLILSVLIPLLLCGLIYGGTKPMVSFLLAAGVLSLLHSYKIDGFVFLHTKDSMLMINSIIYLITLCTQIIVACILKMNINVDRYFDIMEEVQSNLATWIQETAANE